jgi:hypothetical protein
MYAQIGILKRMEGWKKVRDLFLVDMGIANFVGFYGTDFDVSCRPRYLRSYRHEQHKNIVMH